MAGNAHPLAQLVAAAAALGISAPAGAQAAAAATELRYRISNYDEDRLSAPLADGSAQRYQVDKQQFQLAHSLGDRDRVQIGLTREVMSGSSPWFNVPGPGGKPQAIMSGATIHDERQEVSLAWTRSADDGRATTLSASWSGEDDYRALALGAEREQRLGKALTLGYGFSYSLDDIEASDAELFGRVSDERKRVASAFASLAWVLDRDSVIQYGLQLTQSNGYLSDPYKLYYAGGPTLPDARPEQRTQGAALVRYRQAFVDRNAALHLDARWAQDSWGLRSQTLEAAWYQSLPREWKLIPNLRHYSQNSARFYAPYSRTRAEVMRFHSSDYRLSAFGAWSAGLEVRKSWAPVELVIGIDRYRADHGGWSGSDDDPGLVSYTQVHAGFDYHFD